MSRIIHMSVCVLSSTADRDQNSAGACSDGCLLTATG